MSEFGRRAALPRSGYTTPPRRDPFGNNPLRVQVFPERGGRGVEFDLSELPGAEAILGWFAEALAGASGPSGGYRTVSSVRTLWRVIRSFTAYLTTLDTVPVSPQQLRGFHWDAYLLTQLPGSRRGVASGMRSLMRFARDAPEDFVVRIQRNSMGRAQGAKLPSYTTGEFARITNAAKTDVRRCVRRIRSGRALLSAWRDGQIDRDTDLWRWEQGWLLDHIDRHDRVPRHPSGSRHGKSTRHGGTAVLFAELYPTPRDLAAAATLLICLTGHNLSTVVEMPAAHHRPDGDAGATRTAIVEVIKPRRGRSLASMSVAMRETSSDASEQVDVSSPFAVYQLLTEVCGPVRERANSDLLFAYFTPKRGMLFLPGLRRHAVGEWSRVRRLPSDTVDPVTGEPEMLVIDTRRLRMTWLQLHQTPVAHTEATLANDYLARDRGNLLEYQQVVASTLAEQVDAARRVALMRTLTVEQLTRAPTDPDTVAAEVGVSTQVLAQLVGGHLDTVLNGCVDNTHSPHTPAGQACTASFLLCLSCPCARATPAHLPVLVATHDRLREQAAAMTPLRWAERFARPVAQLADIIARFPAAMIEDARAEIGPDQQQLVDRLLSRSLDLR
ncbi:hypothetical protein [Nocardia wallacei]|uniref:Core-binding (CB) domain-containing protein n=1 Tax=Nocardia wallacei TaxID=480035 RepID=A0A7G1KPT4_9NOCA|nr:hypothetical protein [Nocardia wallacei]BCK56203.1 hypothetical protein NWFMUON74_39750 [Nocardia wallacei]